MTTEPANDTNNRNDGDGGGDGKDDSAERDQQRLALEKKRERYVWYYLAYFLFGIHIVAFVMIFAVMHAK